jgi:hypothetical protein
MRQISQKLAEASCCISLGKSNISADHSHFQLQCEARLEQEPFAKQSLKLSGTRPAPQTPKINPKTFTLSFFPHTVNLWRGFEKKSGKNRGEAEMKRETDARRKKRKE